jgi:hypothetical protein
MDILRGITYDTILPLRQVTRLASFEETIARWKRVTDERYDIVERTLTAEGFTARQGTKKSHYIFRHPLIIEVYKTFPQFLNKDFAPDGSLLIVKHDKKVKSVYLKNAARALEVLSEVRAFREKS